MINTDLLSMSPIYFSSPHPHHPPYTSHHAPDSYADKHSSTRNSSHKPNTNAHYTSGHYSAYDHIRTSSASASYTRDILSRRTLTPSVAALLAGIVFRPVRAAPHLDAQPTQPRAEPPPPQRERAQERRRCNLHIQTSPLHPELLAHRSAPCIVLPCRIRSTKRVSTGLFLRPPSLSRRLHGYPCHMLQVCALLVDGDRRDRTRLRC